jgi:hypothetical protein
MKKKNLTPEDNTRLEMFKHLIGILSEPLIFYPADKPEPLFLRELGPLPKHEEEMLWGAWYHQVTIGEVLIDSLVGDMTKLAASEAEQT